MARGQQAVEAMNDMVKELLKVLEMQKETSEHLVRAYATVQNEWDDEKCRELQRVISDITAKIQAPYTDIHECIARIQLLRGALEDYLSIRV
ncbi:hypothetical protein [Collinsella intestinalis]|uniref:hypothetical protein n=1 Tax=Collinsella intestinalis TaxID=147207 RepID=UPI00195865BB|nr:hypothetical protein [Collinsella intestinalis]MBM6907652.1 hypothetical protein [Collinsella intestinalis]